MPSPLLLPTLCCLFAFAILLANSQMTFTDGRGKRSAIAPLAPLTDRNMARSKRQEKPNANLITSPTDGEDGLAMSPAMEACQVGYTQRLMRMHEEMLTLFNTYQQCQTKAMVETKKAAMMQES